MSLPYYKLPCVTTVNMLIGQCVVSMKQNAVKVCVKRLLFDSRLNMYFKKRFFTYAIDAAKQCKPGDIVLIKKLPLRQSKWISHEVIELVHPLGDVTDPITGEKVVANVYRKDREREINQYGRLPSTFDYDKAPPRGRLEGKKDFTDKPTYLKYHVFPEEDPYSYP